MHGKVCSAVRFGSGDQSAAPTADFWQAVCHLPRDGFDAQALLLTACDDGNDLRAGCFADALDATADRLKIDPRQRQRPEELCQRLLLLGLDHEASRLALRYDPAAKGARRSNGKFAVNLADVADMVVVDWRDVAQTPIARQQAFAFSNQHRRDAPTKAGLKRIKHPRLYLRLTLWAVADKRWLAGHQSSSRAAIRSAQSRPASPPQPSHAMRHAVGPPSGSLAS